MPSNVFDSTVELMGYDELLSYATEQTGLPTATVIGRVNGELRSNYYSPSLTYDERNSQALANWLGKQGFEVNYNGDGRWSGSAFSTTAEVVNPSIVDSNSVTIGRGKIRQMYGNLKEWDGTNAFWKMSKFPASGGLGSKALYTVNSVGGAIAAASTGITLGKTIAPALYDAFPNFWDKIGVSQGSFDPENWALLTNGQDGPFAGLFNFILGVDPETRQSQAYMDENAFAYMAYAMKMSSMFDSGSDTSTVDDSVAAQLASLQAGYWALPVGNMLLSSIKYAKGSTEETTNHYTFEVTSGTIYGFVISNPQTQIMRLILCSKDSNNSYVEVRRYGHNIYRTNSKVSYSLTRFGETFYYKDIPYYSSGSSPVAYSNVPINNCLDISQSFGDMSYVVLFGERHPYSPYDGIDNQPDATLPNVSDWNDIPSTLQSLKDQYPDLWDNGMTWNNDDPTSNSHGDVATYIPIAMPSYDYNNSQQPISSTSTQASPALNPTTSDATLLKAILESIQATQTQTQPNMQVPPQNPVTTGTGEPPALVPPSGSASALWSVYHPTQAQVNSFGAWLWTDDIITKINQLLQNPMEGIITLHKVFAPPVDSGQGTIVVGRLDSNVPSATVNQQYVTVDCGEIDCLEQFGNVFDYSPFTSISIYLPFIGIAPLSVDDIMRSKIHVKYGVDVFTGVCLAMIEVSRDGNTVNMYQHAGVASVEYPLTGTVHNGLITGIMGIVGGFATIATAGAAAPVAAAGGVAAAGVGALTTGRQSQSRSGNFSGNAGAMGIKTPYLIIERPQTKVADTFPQLAGYPTNKSVILNDCSGHVVVKHVHVEGVNATQGELIEIENLLQSGVLV